jgi:hypothetical protein
MKRLLVNGAAGLLGLLLVQAGLARAQYVPPGMPSVGPGNSPMLNPYLNLLRGTGTTFTPGATGVTTSFNVFGNSVDPAVNYFLGTLPEAQRRLNYVQQQREIGELESGPRVGAVGGPDEIDVLLTPLRGTGHPATFNNTGGYFSNSRVANRPLNQQGYRPNMSTPGRPGMGSGSGSGYGTGYR